MVEGAIFWKSDKQIAYLTLVVEFIVSYKVFHYSLWHKNVITWLRITNNIKRPLKFFWRQINNLAIKEKVQDKLITIEHIGTNYMIVDSLTKADT